MHARNYLIDVTKQFVLYFVLLMFTVNMHGLSDICSRCAWFIRLHVEKGETITKDFKKYSELYNRSIKSWLKDNYVDIYSTHNEGKSEAPELFIKT